MDLNIQSSLVNDHITEEHFKQSVERLTITIEQAKKDGLNSIYLPLFDDALVKADDVSMSLVLAQAVVDLKLKGVSLKIKEYIYQFYPFGKTDHAFVATWLDCECDVFVEK